MNNIHPSWNPIVGLLYQEPLVTLNNNILPNISYQPKKEDIFNVFSMPLDDVKVVILGQEPYPTPGDAIGYSFAVPEDRRIPASLRIIRQELYNELGEELNMFPDSYWQPLEHWRRQGVLLLNTALTVETGKAGSHLKYWEQFTQRVIFHIATQNPCIWVLWGKKAEKFLPYITMNPFHVKGYDKETIKFLPASPDYNYILTAPHPAAEESYSGDKAGFYGCNHFYFINEILSLLNKKLINF